MGLAIDLRQTEWTPASEDLLADLLAFLADGEGLAAYPEITPSAPANDNWVLQPPLSQVGEWAHAVWCPRWRTAD
jgi:hypothetical protein